MVDPTRTNRLTRLAHPTSSQWLCCCQDRRWEAAKPNKSSFKEEKFTGTAQT